MQTKITLFIMILMSNICYSQSQHFRVIEDPGWGGGVAILEEESGNYLIGAASRGQFDTTSNILLLAIDSMNGNTLSELHFGNNEFTELSSMQFTGDNGLIIGGSKPNQVYYSSYLLKLNQNKEYEWSLSMPNSNVTIFGYSAIELFDNTFIILAARHYDTFDTTYVQRVSENGELMIVDTINFKANQVVSASDSTLMFIGRKFIDDHNSNIVVAKQTTRQKEKRARKRLS